MVEIHALCVFPQNVVVLLCRPKLLSSVIFSKRRVVAVALLCSIGMHLGGKGVASLCTSARPTFVTIIVASPA